MAPRTAEKAPLKFFASQAEFRRWLAKNHASRKELLVGLHKRDSGRGGLTYPQALDEALCYGWIDGVRRGIDEHAFSIRFTPRKPKSIWSAVNLRHVERLRKAGRMAPAGLAAWKARDPKRIAVYSFENLPKSLSPEFEQRFRADARAWAFFRASRPSYQRTATYWVMSAKQEATRERRLAQLIESSSRGELAPPYTY